MRIAMIKYFLSVLLILFVSLESLMLNNIWAKQINQKEIDLGILKNDINGDYASYFGVELSKEKFLEIINNHNYRSNKEKFLNLNGAIISSFQLQNIRLENISFDLATLENLEITGSIFTNCTFKSTDFINFKFKDVKIINGSFDGCNFGKRNNFIEKSIFDSSFKINYRNAEFVDVDFINIDFSYSEFWNVKFLGVKIINSRSSLSGNTFYNSNFENVDFLNNNFENVEFKNSELNKINFINSNFKYLEFSESKLKETNIKNSICYFLKFLNDSKLKKVNIENVNSFLKDNEELFLSSFEIDGNVEYIDSKIMNFKIGCLSILNSKLTDINFFNVTSGYDCEKSEFADCYESETLIIGTTLKDVIIENSNFKNAHFEEAILDKTYLLDSFLNDSYFFNSMLINNSYIAESKLANSEFKNVTMKALSIINSDLESSKINSSILEFIIFEECNLIKSSFEYNNLKTLFFVESNLDYINFSSENLKYSSFIGNTIKNSKFDFTNLSLTLFWENEIQNSDFTGAELPTTQTQISIRDLYNNTFLLVDQNGSIEEAIDDILGTTSEKIPLIIDSGIKGALNGLMDSLWDNYKHNPEMKKILKELNLPYQKFQSKEELLRFWISDMKSKPTKWFSELPKKLQIALLSEPEDLLIWCRNVLIEGHSYFIGIFEKKYPKHFNQFPVEFVAALKENPSNYANWFKNVFLSGKDYFLDVFIKKNSSIYRALPNHFKEILESDASDLSIWIKRVAIAGSDISFPIVNNFKFFQIWKSNNFNNALFSDIDWDGVRLNSIPLCAPNLLSFYEAKNLHKINVWRSQHTLSEIKNGLKEAGLREQERDITYALKKSERLMKKESGKTVDFIESYLLYILFELTSDWGRSPNKPLGILGYIWIITALYFSAIIYKNGKVESELNQQGLSPFEIQQYFVNNYHLSINSIWATIPVYDNENMFKNNKIECITPNFFYHEAHKKLYNLKFPPFFQFSLMIWSTISFGFYYSLYTAFQISWTQFKFGNLISRLQMREYSLHATGIARIISGLNSIISLYLITLWFIILFAPTDLQNLPDRKSYDIFNLIEPMMISISSQTQDKVLYSVSAP
jgi:uncharacterized protein YjbI with pentapeptide repeats